MLVSEVKIRKYKSLNIVTAFDNSLENAFMNITLTYNLRQLSVFKKT